MRITANRRHSRVSEIELFNSKTSLKIRNSTFPTLNTFTPAPWTESKSRPSKRPREPGCRIFDRAEKYSYFLKRIWNTHLGNFQNRIDWARRIIGCGANNLEIIGAFRSVNQGNSNNYHTDIPIDRFLQFPQIDSIIFVRLHVANLHSAEMGTLKIRKYKIVKNHRLFFYQNNLSNIPENGGKKTKKWPYQKRHAQSWSREWRGSQCLWLGPGFCTRNKPWWWIQCLPSSGFR